MKFNCLALKKYLRSRYCNILLPVCFKFKGRFLLFQVYRNFANLVSKLFVSPFYKVISKFQQKVQN